MGKKEDERNGEGNGEREDGIGKKGGKRKGEIDEREGKRRGDNGGGRKVGYIIG